MANNGDDDERAPKRLRVDDGCTADVDAVSATRDQLMRTSDPHLQAKLLLEYSTLAIAPDAKTEAAIDFLFAFLQQSQSTAANGSKEDDTKKTEGSSNGGGGGGGNAVVVAAIVRGLRSLLAVKPSCVEPMIQDDGMSEQLTQCISVPEDFKLRRDMLRIVLDCLFAARKFSDTEQLLGACMADHDEGLQAICLQGYIRLLHGDHQLDAAATQSLVDRLASMLLFGEDEQTRLLVPRLLGILAESPVKAPSCTSATFRSQEKIVHVLAAASRDPSPRVRREIASSFRCFRTCSASLYAHLFQKKQINEDLSEIDTQSMAMLSSGAILTLLEDDEIEVATETSISIGLLCEAGSWSLDLLEQAAVAHMELLGRIRSRESNLLDVLHSLTVLLAKRDDVAPNGLELSREELNYLLGSIPATHGPVARAFFLMLPSIASDHTHAACRILNFIIQCARGQPSFPCTAVVVASEEQSMRVAAQRLADNWRKDCVSIPAATMAELRPVALAQSHSNPMATGCKLLHDMLCPPADRLTRNTADQLPASHHAMPSFLSAANKSSTAANCAAVVSHLSTRAQAASAIDQVAQALRVVQQLVMQHKSQESVHFEREPLCSQVVVSSCEALLRSSRALYVCSHHCIDDKAKAILVQLMYVGAWGSMSLSAADSTPLQLLGPEIAGFVQDTVAPSLVLLQESVDGESTTTSDREEFFRQLATSCSVDELRKQLSSGQLDNIASASIVEPAASASVETLEVSSQVPFSLHVRCALHYEVPSYSDLNVEVQLPSGECIYPPLRIIKRSDGVDAEAQVAVRVKPFSDPTRLAIAVCLKGSRVFPPSQAAEYYKVSPVTKVLIQHRFNSALRQQSSSRNA